MTNLPANVIPVKSSKLDDRVAQQTAESIQTWLAQWLADELAIKVDAIDTRKSFVYYGLDSVTTVRLADDLEDWLDRQLSPTLAWDYPSISSLACHLAGEARVTSTSNETTMISIV